MCMYATSIRRCVTILPVVLGTIQGRNQYYKHGGLYYYTLRLVETEAALSPVKGVKRSTTGCVGDCVFGALAATQHRQCMIPTRAQKESF